jgi:hypothetical protein
MDSDIAAPEPCGSWRILEYIEGAASRIRWCERTDGPCPFPGTDESNSSERKCATSPGTRLRVTWADTAVEEALYDLKQYRDMTPPVAKLHSQTLSVAIDAITSCLKP